MTRIYYMIDANGNRLEASKWSGFAEKYGISNHSVILSCLGGIIKSDVTFEYKYYEKF